MVDMKTFRNIGIAGLLMLCIGLAGQTLVQGSVAERPARSMLSWGEAFFPYPTWLASIQETGKQVTGSWSQTNIIVNNERNSAFKNLAVAQVDKIVDLTFIKGLMSKYDTWNLSQRCIIGHYLLLNVNATNQGQTYSTRFWIWSDAANWNVLFAAYPKTSEEDLNTLAGRMFKDAADCPVSAPLSTPVFSATDATPDF